LLKTWSSNGRREALDQLITVVHGDLRRLARVQMASERPEHTLDVTALVNEAFLRLVDQRQTDWQNRAHFLGVAASCMRRVLVDHARRRRALKRPRRRVPLDDIFASGVENIDDVLPVHEALESLAQLDRSQAAIVELRFFAGLTIDEIAAASGVSSSTVKRELHTARLFLKTRLKTFRP
jgi:RNA polymerase sigma factor (TIGR02999 family)